MRMVGGLLILLASTMLLEGTPARAEQIVRLYGDAIPVYQDRQLVGRWSVDQFPRLPIPVHRKEDGVVIFLVNNQEYEVRRMSVDLSGGDQPGIECHAQRGGSGSTIAGTSGFSSCD